MNKKELLLLSIGIFFTVIAWLIADLYHAATAEKIKTRVEGPTLKKYAVSTDIFKALEERQN
jgi:uncharacterized protein involved in cysteine biosynthesis